MFAGLPVILAGLPVILAGLLVSLAGLLVSLAGLLVRDDFCYKRLAIDPPNTQICLDYSKWKSNVLISARIVQRYTVQGDYVARFTIKG